MRFLTPCGDYKEIAIYKQFDYNNFEEIDIYNLYFVAEFDFS